MITREKYLNPIRGFYESDLIKVITGVRRCGKSVILETIMEEIKEKSNNVIYLNFEKTDDFLKANTVEKLVEYIRKNKKSGTCYCFFDEIQEIEDWQRAVKDLRLEDCSIFITGSNSKLLSREFLTLLSGRFVSFRIRPFVYKEIMEYSKAYHVDVSKIDYLIWGGFPGRLQNVTPEGTKAYVSDLENTIVINDLIKRYKIRKEVAFKKFASFVLSSNARIYSLRSIHKYMSQDFPDLSLSTIQRFMEHLKEAYIVDEIPQYSTKTKSELKYYGKVYDSDVCFNSIRIANNRYDLDHNLENVVYNELLYMGYDLKVFGNKEKEIDFVAEKNNKTFFIQVAYSVQDAKAYEREMSAFNDLDNSNQKILITNDDLDYSTSTVRHIRLDDFLLMSDL